MKEILFGTTNEAKVKQIQDVLSLVNIKVRGVINKESLPDVEENGQTAIENARIKALAYAKTFNEPVFFYGQFSSPQWSPTRKTTKNQR